MHDLSAQLREEARAARALNASILSLLQRQEKNLHAFLELQQGSTLNYLEQIESTVLQHQVMVESNLISPMVEYVCQGFLEANTTRKLVTRLFTEGVKGFNLDTQPAQPYQTQTTRMDNERDKELTARMSSFLHTNRVPKPDQTSKPWVFKAPPLTPIDAPDAPSIRDVAPK